MSDDPKPCPHTTLIELPLPVRCADCHLELTPEQVEAIASAKYVEELAGPKAC